MKLATIIVTYNGAAYIEKCLCALLEYTSTDHQIFVIDNASIDTTVQLVEGKFPTVVLTKSSTNLGFGQANNKGIRLALDWGADYFFLLNQDAYVVEGAISKILEVAIGNPDFGIVSPVHLNGSKSGFDHGFIQHIARKGEANQMLFDLLQGKRKVIYPVSFVNAAAWLLSKSCIEKVGGFAPLFFHYGEDDNYVHRAQYHGFKVGVCLEAAISHDRLQSNGINSFEMQFRLFLIEAANINEPFSKSFGKRNGWLRSAAKSIILFKFEEALGYLRLFSRAGVIKTRIDQERVLMINGSLTGI